MVVTADDYYRFINFPNYFSKRLDTLLEENTTVIVGYSLGDVNFKSILNSHRYSSSHAVNRQHLFYLSRKKVPQHVKDYYDTSYGLRVIDSTEIPDLFAKIDTQYDAIKEDVKDAKAQLQRALVGQKKYTDSYLKKRESFTKILATISSTGF
jgi:SIR2-like domain